MRVAILDDIHRVWDATDGVRRLRAHAEVQIFTSPFGHPDVLRGCDALIANRERTPFTRELLEQLPDVRIIAQTGNHAYHIDLAAADACGIVVARVTGGRSAGTIELTFGLAIAVMRQIVAADQALRRNEWPTPVTRVLSGKTWGIVGFGRIGHEVARIARAFEMRVIAWGRSLTEDAAREAGLERRELDDLMREADVVSIHLALAPATRGLIDSRRLGLMKGTAYLINTARGPIVDEAALVSALTAHQIAGAGLDVFDEEPLPADHPLTKLSNVVLTPHLGWPTDQAYGRFADVAADVLLAYLAGKPVPRFLPGH